MLLRSRRACYCCLQVVLLTCPSERLQGESWAKGREVVARRNELLRQMVPHTRGGSAPSEGSEGSGNISGDGASSEGGGGGASGRGGSPLMLVDIDAMTQAGLPPAVTLGLGERPAARSPAT